jgi:hypothetical protein
MFFFTKTNKTFKALSIYLNGGTIVHAPYYPENSKINDRIEISTFGYPLEC